MPLSSWVTDKLYRDVRPAIPLLSFILFGTVLVSAVGADSLGLRGDFNYINTEIDQTNKSSGIETSSDFSFLDQKYNFDFSKTIFPYLTFQGGTFYRIQDSTTTAESTETKLEERLLRPFVELNLNNPNYRAATTYRRSERKQAVTGLDETEDFRDELDLFFGVRRTRIPDFNIRYNQTHTYEALDVRDDITRLLTFDINTTLWRKVDIDYFYSRNQEEDRNQDSEVLDQTHSGNINYTDNFADGRLFLNTRYNIRYNILEFPTLADFESQLLPTAGLFSLDDTPEDGPALGSNNQLIDGNLTVSAGIDIGLDGDETTLTNIGLDFSFPATVTSLRIWIDRPLPLSVSSSFSWSIYTSPDNTGTSTWTLLTTVSPAPFGVFDNRFEIIIPEVTTRFIKVVTEPLSPLVPGAANFQNIFITELEAFTTLRGESATNKDATINHNYVLNLRHRLTPRTTIGYDLNYRLERRDPPQDAPPEDRSELTNGIYANHAFNEVYSVTGRTQRRDTTLLDRDIVEYDYSASLRAAYFRNFGQTLTYSGSSREEDDDSSYANSIFLRNNATFYRGWDGFLDIGYSWNKPLGRTREDSKFLRLGTGLQPNSKLDINLNYSYTKTERTQEVDRDTTDSRFDLQVLYVPTDTLSLSAKLTITDRGEQQTNFQNYALNWSPFPDGALQFFFTYSETLRLDVDQQESIIGPSLQWTLGGWAYLDLAYNWVTNENDFQKTDSRNFIANLRLIY